MPCRSGLLPGIRGAFCPIAEIGASNRTASATAAAANRSTIRILSLCRNDLLEDDACRPGGCQRKRGEHDPKSDRGRGGACCWDGGSRIAGSITVSHLKRRDLVRRRTAHSRRWPPAHSKR